MIFGPVNAGAGIRQVWRESSSRSGDLHAAVTCWNWVKALVRHQNRLNCDAFRGWGRIQKSGDRRQARRAGMGAGYTKDTKKTPFDVAQDRRRGRMGGRERQHDGNRDGRPTIRRGRGGIPTRQASRPTNRRRRRALEEVADISVYR